jgi:hypothetical protein
MESLCLFHDIRQAEAYVAQKLIPPREQIHKGLFANPSRKNHSLNRDKQSISTNYPKPFRRSNRGEELTWELLFVLQLVCSNTPRIPIATNGSSSSPTPRQPSENPLIPFKQFQNEPFTIQIGDSVSLGQESDCRLMQERAWS